jgi:hypothetical protein
MAGRRGKGASAISFCKNSGCDISECVVPSRQGVFSFSTTCPAALICTRSLISSFPRYANAVNIDGGLSESPV